MESRFKFRAWDGETMRILDQQFVGVGQVGWSDTHYVDISFDDQEMATQLMQYTGLKDKHGVEIYEGDIYRVNGSRIIYVVSFVAGAFIGGHMTGTGSPLGWMNNEQDWPWIDTLEIVGNIYENPELLEVAS